MITAASRHTKAATAGQEVAEPVVLLLLNHDTYTSLSSGPQLAQAQAPRMHRWQAPSSTALMAQLGMHS